MLTDKQIEAVEDTAAELDRRRAQKPADSASPPTKKTEMSPDRLWARKNLRFRDGHPRLDLANVIRVLERNESYQGRFRFNDTLGKVLDKGTVMLDWRMMEVCAEIQERFLPEVSEDKVRTALVIVANRAIAKK